MGFDIQWGKKKANSATITSFDRESEMEIVTSLFQFCY